MLALLLAAQLSANGLAVRPEVLCASRRALQTSAPAPALLLRPQDRNDVRALKLKDLPRADKEVAVARTVGGCAVPVGVRSSVEGDGRFAAGQ